MDGGFEEGGLGREVLVEGAGAGVEAAGGLGPGPKIVSRMTLTPGERVYVVLPDRPAGAPGVGVRGVLLLRRKLPADVER